MPGYKVQAKVNLFENIEEGKVNRREVFFQNAKIPPSVQITNMF